MLSLAAVGVPMLSAWLLGAALLVALAVDRWLGEPPRRWHPVVWIGRYLGWAGRWVQARACQEPGGGADYMAFCLGAMVWSVGAAVVWIVSYGLQQGVVWMLAVAMEQGTWLQAGGAGLAALLLGSLLKPLLAWALLKSEVLAVERALQPAHGGSLAHGRERLRWLVSRDVTELNETQVRESAIETLAENLNDSVVAPLFWFVLLGLPGAALFRFANTADAMWGYRGLYQGRNWEWAGKWAAWADDVLCWLPARLLGLVLLAVGRWGAPRAAPGAPLKSMHWCQLRVEARRTSSPNSGWPMAAMALALGIRLSKPGGYVLNAGAAQARHTHTACALQHAQKSLFVVVTIAFVAIVLIAQGVWHHG